MSTTGGATELRAIARDAYVFLFPMLMGYRYLCGSFLRPDLPSHLAPVNTLSGQPQTFDHTFRDVITPNADTPYSMAALDLRAEPMVLSVPAVADRFYHFQFEDLWGHNAHYLGTRTTGTGPGTYLLAGPRWEGTAPDGVEDVLRFETDIVFVIGRTQLLGSDDVERLGRIMAAYDLRPLSTETGERAPLATPQDWPAWVDDASRDERFIGVASALLPLCRPFHPEDAPHLERFARIGIGAGAPFDASTLAVDDRHAIRDGVEDARRAMAASVDTLGRKINGWVLAWVFGDRAFFDGDHLLRAAGALTGWGGNDAAEALYPMAREDAAGARLHGDRRYRLTLTERPPAEAFWSVTMYDTSYDGTAGYLVENPIGRYLVNSTTEGLVVADDGSLTLAIQQQRPDTDEGRSNWLPAPAGTFYLVLRVYLPGPAALDGSWEPPPIERIG